MFALGDELAQHMADLLDDVGLNAFGRLVEQEHLGIAGQSAGDGQLLLLPAGEIAAHAPGHRLEHREKLVHSSGMVLLPSVRACRPTRRFSSTVSFGKICRPCGTRAMPALARLLAGSRADVPVIEQHRCP